MAEIKDIIWQSVKTKPTLENCTDFLGFADSHNDVTNLRKAMSVPMRDAGDEEEMSRWDALMFRSYCIGAEYSFDDFMLAMEWYREPKARFWMPRRSILEGRHKVVSTISDFLADDNSEYLGFSLPPGTGKTTLIKFLLTYIYGRYPLSSNMYVSYSDAMVKMMYDSVVGMLLDGEYSYNKIFPNEKKPTVSAEYYTISARNKGDFPTLGLISLGGSVTGRTRANHLLVTDDLVKNKEVARSPIRLETLYEDYKATLTTRTIGDNVKQIQLGTIWSAHDPISRMKAEHEGDDRYRFISIPVCDENGESNFEYEHPDRYTKDRINTLRESLDPVDFSCLYMQQGMEKEGLAFPSGDLYYYNGELPEGHPDNIIFWVDVAFGGGDSLSMPIAYVYGKSVYIHDVVFDRGNKAKTMPRVIGKIIHNNAMNGTFEANAGGEVYAEEVDKALREQGYHCHIRSMRANNKISKEKRVEQFHPDIKEFYFRDSRHWDNDYRKFMEELCTFSFTSKNLHDDAADSLAGLCSILYKGSNGRIEIIRRSF